MYKLIIIGLLVVVVFFVRRMNPYFMCRCLNRIYSFHCSNNAVLDTDNYSWSKLLRENWQVIRDEYLEYNGYIPTHKEVNSNVSNIVQSGQWRTLYLRAYNKDTELIDQFPKTKELINKISNCTLANFSILEPNTELEPHIGVYKGVLRYHLGLIVPKDYEKCSLKVNDKVLYWKEGEDLMFDDLFLHSVANNTDEKRVILFLDIKRDFGKGVIGKLLNSVNNISLHFISTCDEVNKTINNANKFKERSL